MPRQTEPYIWLNDGEEEGIANCRCRLVCNAYRFNNPAVYFCKLHQSAEALLAACQDIATNYRLTPIDPYHKEQPKDAIQRLLNAITAATSSTTGGQ